MVKFFAKKLNKKGFTLAELLIVVAIIAILIAIAVPIYTSALKDAQIKVNLANARTLKGAAVSYILAHWTEEDGAKTVAGGSSSYKYSDGGSNGNTAAAKGWVAIGTFDTNGDISGMKVGVLTVAAPTSDKYYVTTTSGASVAINDLLTKSMSTLTTSWEAINSGASPSTGDTANTNTVCVYIGEADVKNAA